MSKWVTDEARLEMLPHLKNSLGTDKRTMTMSLLELLITAKNKKQHLSIYINIIILAYTTRITLWFWPKWRVLELFQQDLKFELFGNLGLNYTLILTHFDQYLWTQHNWCFFLNGTYWNYQPITETWHLHNVICGTSHHNWIARNTSFECQKLKEEEVQSIIDMSSGIAIGRR